MIPLSHVLMLSGILFSLSAAGIFINRKNILLLLMCIELMLLSVNFNFIAFSYYLGDLSGQVFVFFILTVAAAESAIGLAILVVLFRQRRSINVDDLDTLRGCAWNICCSSSCSHLCSLRSWSGCSGDGSGGQGPTP